MSIFGSRKESPAPPKPAASPSNPQQIPRTRVPEKTPATGGGATHIARSSRVVGVITGDAELVIDGKVEGEIRLESRVVVGPEGRVEGTIQARSVEVGGKVEGNIRGVERVQVLASGSLEGDVAAPKVKIDEGAFFKGNVDMSGGAAKPASGGSKSQETKAGSKPRDESAGGASSTSGQEKDAGAKDRGRPGSESAKSDTSNPTSNSAKESGRPGGSR